MRHQVRTRWERCLGLVVVSAWLAGCASSASQPAQPAPPQPLAAHSLAQREYGLLAGGDFAGAWTLWASSAQQAISQQNYQLLNTECRPALGVPYVITNVARTGQDTVVVSWKHGTATGQDSVSYRHGAWRFVPAPAELADYRLGVSALVAKRKAAGECRS